MAKKLRGSKIQETEIRKNEIPVLPVPQVYQPNPSRRHLPASKADTKLVLFRAPKKIDPLWTTNLVSFSPGVPL